MHLTDTPRAMLPTRSGGMGQQQESAEFLKRHAETLWAGEFI